MVLAALGAAVLWPMAPPSQAAPVLPPLNVSATALQLPGAFVWFDLATDDVTAARAFYGAVFGWTFRGAGDDASGYTVISLGQRDIGGIFRPAGASSRSGRWLSLMSVPDPVAAARFTEQHGGKVLVAPATMARRGMHALLADPEGAVFGVLRSSSGDPADGAVADGEFFWADLFSRAPATAAEFYRGLAGYEVSPMALEINGVQRVLLSAAGFARASIAPLPQPDMQPGWLPYILVSDVAATVERAKQAGGSVVLAASPEVLDGQLAVIADPRGGVIGIVNWRAPEPAQGASR